MTSAGADRDREQRWARHARRVAALRAQREQRGREPHTSVVSQLADPFAAIDQDPQMAAIERAFA